jgi:tetratricopeptide (TPR) repeat protein
MTITSSPTTADQAMKLFKADEFDQAALLFQQAAVEFEQAGQFSLAAEARNNQSVALLQAGKPDEALKAARGTEDIFSSTGDPLRQAQALGNQAAALQDLNQLGQAADLYLKAAEIFKSINQLDFFTLVMKNVSSIRMKQRRFLDSLFAMNQALSVKRNLTLRERLIRSLSNLAFRMFNRPPSI